MTSNYHSIKNKKYFIHFQHDKSTKRQLQKGLIYSELLKGLRGIHQLKNSLAVLLKIIKDNKSSALFITNYVMPQIPLFQSATNIYYASEHPL